jgi:hypothetical protein
VRRVHVRALRCVHERQWWRRDVLREVCVMPDGPGKYDTIATMARELSGGHTVVVLVLGGSRGEGFSVQTRDPMMARALPGLLRSIANDIERDIELRVKS